MDYTQIAILVVSLVFSILGVIALRHVIPWLKANNLYEAAMVAVTAAEALYGRYHGEDKLRYALNVMQGKGFNIEADDVINAINAAWKELDLAMREAGEKENGPFEDTDKPVEELVEEEPKAEEEEPVIEETVEDDDRK